jgi:hypothetical protein
MNYPQYLKKEKTGYYFKIINESSYACVKILQNVKGCHYSYLKTTCTRESTDMILEDLNLEKSNEIEFLENLQRYKDYLQKEVEDS